MTWFGGKAVFRVAIAQGDGEGSFHAALLEERLVILDCDNADSALERLEGLADEYAKQGTWYNADGQAIRTRRLAALDVYRISHDISDGGEVYSRTEIVQSSVSDDELVRRFFWSGRIRRRAGHSKSIRTEFGANGGGAWYTSKR